MNSDKNRKSEIEDRAAGWVLKNDRGLTAAEQDAFTEWLSESAENRAAYAEHRLAWAEFSRLAGLQNTDYAPVVPDLLGMDNSPWYQKIIKFPGLSVALSVAALLVFAVGYFFMDQAGEKHAPGQVIQLVIANQITQNQLDDGSVVDLNKGAEIETYFTDRQRFVKLISGEANFNVEKDPSRPFIVEALGIRMRAVGTVFNVRMMDNQISLIVTEGTVAVQHPDLNPESSNSPENESLVQQNFRATVDIQPDGARIAVNPFREEDMKKELIWQPRLIDFENSPLSSIISEFNRRNPVSIIIEDEELGSLRFTSIFWSHNVESFVRLLEANYGITAEVISENQILLKKSPAAL